MTNDDPFSQELLSMQERSITGDHVAFSSYEVKPERFDD
jgi:hypothetical protein